MSKRILAAVALAAFLTLGPGLRDRATAAAEASAAPAAASEALLAERARLRAALDRVNAEIDLLKRAGGGVRDDYRLRARLADAESLARKLIDIEASLGLHLDGGVPSPAAAAADGRRDRWPPIWTPRPTSSPTSAPAPRPGDALAAARELKGRQELRRRVADLDRDPFAPMEGSKRRVASASTTTTPRAGAVRRGAGRRAAARRASTPRAARTPPRPASSGGNGNAPSTATPRLPAPTPVVTATSFRCSCAICWTPRRWPTSASWRRRAPAPRRRRR